MNDTTTTLAIGHRTIPLDPPRPPRKPDMLLWIDTETTGVDPYQCELLEVGMQVTDMTGKHPHDSLHLIVHPDNIRNWANHPELLKAYEMHLANGLMLASAEAPKDTYDYQHTAWNIHEFLNDQLCQYTLHPAGTNVDFDLRQLDVHLSRHLNHPIAERLHHRKLDITTLRLTDQAIGRDPYQNHAGTHRVQDCIHSTTTPPTSTSCEPASKEPNHEPPQTNTRNPHGDPRHPRAHGMRRDTQRRRPGHREQPRPRIRPLVRTARRQRGRPMLLRLRRSVMRLGTHRTQGQAMNAHTATPDRPNPVIELIRRLRKATHRPEPANDPTICAICGAPLTDTTSSICPDCRELEKDW